MRSRVFRPSVRPGHRWLKSPCRSQGKLATDVSNEKEDMKEEEWEEEEDMKEGEEERAEFQPPTITMTGMVYLGFEHQDDLKLSGTYQVKYRFRDRCGC
ncbi:hypothetical protein PoB_001207500 [Plakobranchus ocellatus]|uniref:Uncharacterized protein n=1 Tax=Plakobranchus ocellatus TaxID=259542 RepID=A0AAV3YT29_9GAST|nr:hypothetical protein PoB_001207500 [Plakobranchus ocellatus]